MSEVRLGVTAHKVSGAFLPIVLPTDYNLTEINDVSFDVLFHSPQAEVFRWIGSPRPNLGATVSLAGRESLFHAAMTWHLQLFSTAFFLEGTLGAALHNGYLDNAPDGFRNMGCRVQLYEAFGAGADLTSNLTATVTWEHTSNDSLCTPNDGLTNLGIQVGYKF